MEINEILAILMFVSFIFLLFSGFPVAWILGGIAVLFSAIAIFSDTYFDTFIGIDWNYLSITVPRIFDVMTNWVLVALPMFIYMGLMLDRSGIAEDLMTNLSKLFGRLRGGLAISVVLIGMLLAATTGIIGASVVLLTVLSVPMMLKVGYKKEVVSGLVCSTGTLGILIPPSIMLVMMGDRIGVSVGDLFLGAFLPGILLGILYILYIIVYGMIKPYAIPAVPNPEPVTFDLIWRVIKSIFAPALLILFVLGSIFKGIATPTEASGMGAFGATILALFKRKLSFAVFNDVCQETTKTTAFIFALIVGATAFSLVLRGLGGDDLISDALLGLPFGPMGIVLAILLFTFLLGFVLDWIEITLILLPLVAPVVSDLGFDLVWFTIAFAVCLQTSFLTPPVGFALFYMKGVAPKEISVKDIYKGVFPFVVMQLIGLTIILFYQDIVLWLPRLAYGQ